MRENLEVTLKRNRLMVKILWGITLIFISYNTLTGVGKSVLLTAGPTLVVVSLITTILVRFNIATMRMKYLIAIALSFIHFLFVHLFFDINGFLIAYVMLAVISLYQNYKVILLTGFLEMGSMIYGYVAGGEQMYGHFHEPVGLASIMVAVGLAVVLLAVQAMSTERIRSEVEEKRQQTEASRKQLAEMVTTIKGSIQGLQQFSLNLKENVNVTGSISREVTTAFHQISANVESQTDILDDIYQVKSTETEEIKNVGREIDTMFDLSKDNLVKSTHINQNADSLETEMEVVNQHVENAATSMTNLRALSEKMDTIQNSVGNITKQINLLALNASIEAARAGAEGKGFSVVAQEVGELAEQSSQFNNQIKEILKEIVGRVEEMSSQIELIQNSFNSSRKSVTEVNTSSKDVNINSESVVSKASLVNQLAHKMEDTSEDIFQKISGVTDFAKEVTSSVEDVLRGVEEQDHRVAEIVESFQTFENLVSDLIHLTGEEV